MEPRQAAPRAMTGEDSSRLAQDRGAEEDNSALEEQTKVEEGKPEPAQDIKAAERQSAGGTPAAVVPGAPEQRSTEAE